MKDTYGFSNNVVFNKYHRFTQKAMATYFEIYIDHDDRLYSEQAAFAAFEELERIENDLSRYIQTSDIYQINKSTVHTPIKVSINSLECLQHAETFYYLTNGIFDITSGDIIDQWKNQENEQKSTHNEVTSQTVLISFGLSIDEHNNTICKTRDNVLIDLGGIGKGYALDCMKKVLQEWDIERALLHSGWSTVLSIESPKFEKGWHLTINHPITNKLIRKIFLNQNSISGSGLQKGKHIIDPRTQHATNQTLAAWVISNDATSADALSTTYMIESVHKVNELLSKKSKEIKFIELNDVVIAETDYSMYYDE